MSKYDAKGAKDLASALKDKPDRSPTPSAESGNMPSAENGASRASGQGAR